ncbi:hypothetical protein ACSS7Z_10550 [Microbacterium sp. A82]|uniref:hypothetical protein n=1 Tax=unclassified Microbacterium TaxID=2609290 RepID=UPI003F2EE4DA
MRKPTLDELLTGSGRDYTPPASTSAALDSVVAEARRSASRVRKPARALWLIPGAIVAVGALTASAVVVDNLLHADLPLAVEYTTNTGIPVSCTAQIEGGSLFATQPHAVIEYFQTHDFSGIGQRIYDYALVLTGDTEATPGVLPASSQWIPTDEFLSDDEAFSFSLTSFLLTDALVELDISGSGDSWLSSDCTGQLR